jgi:hypothetical protein
MHGVPGGLCLLWRQLLGGLPFQLCITGGEQLVFGVRLQDGLVRAAWRCVSSVRGGWVVLWRSAEPVHCQQHVGGWLVFCYKLCLQRGLRANGCRGMLGVWCRNVVQRGDQARMRSQLFVNGTEQRGDGVRVRSGVLRACWRDLCSLSGGVMVCRRGAEHVPGVVVCRGGEQRGDGLQVLSGLGGARWGGLPCLPAGRVVRWGH